MITVSIIANGASLDISQPIIADGSTGGIEARFCTDSLWHGLSLTAVFRTDSGDILMPLENGRCEVPFEATENTNGALDAAITIGTNAFAAGAGTKSLTAININAGTNITTIGNSAFKNNTVLTDINIDSAAYVGVIGNSAFAYCSALVTVDIPATVTTIDSYAFSRCTSLVNVNFKTTGATTLDIADYTFSECTKLGTILLPDHLNEFLI